MAKAQHAATTNASKPTPQEMNDKLNSAHLTGEEIDHAAAFKTFKDIESDQLEELTSEYFNFKTPGTYHFFFTGMTKYEKDGKVVDAVLLRDEDDKSYINANAVLVNSCKKVTSIPCYIRVEYIGEVKSPGGTYKSLKVLHFKSEE